MASSIEQQIVRLNISVDESQFVDRIDGQRRFGDVKLSAFFRQSVSLHQQRHHVACKNI
jgi:hypothetical protein